MQHWILLAQANEDINSWLDQNPMVLGLIFLVIGLVLGGWGIYELATGVSRGKRGEQLSPGLGKFVSVLRVVAGVGCIGFALYRMVMG